MKDIVKDIERLYEWACNRANDDCRRCNFSIEDGDSRRYLCPFDNVIRAAEDRAKEVEKCHT